MRDSQAEQIVKKLPETVLRLLHATAEATAKPGMNIYLVGGIVRDLLLFRPSMDIDIMVEGHALAVAESMSSILNHRPVIHKKFGTATFKLGNYRVDLSTCRSEKYEYAGALPQVKPGSLKEDLFRRDFTVNAIAIRINPTRFGELIDYYSGRQDLGNKLIRILHDESFHDDATRIMRAVRYEQRLNFNLEDKTEKLLRRDLDMLDTISGDRLRHEIILWFSEAQPEEILRRAGQLGILPKLHPALTWDMHLKKAFQSAREITRGSPLLHLYLALLIYGMDERQLDKLLLRLSLHGGRLHVITKETLRLKNNLAALDDKVMQPSAIYAKLKNFDIISVRANSLSVTSQNIHNMLELYLKKLRLTKTMLNGKDLAQMGIPEGKLMGTILNRLLEAKLDGEVSTRLDEEKLARSLAEDLP